MGDSSVQLRIRVIVVSTRAALRSLSPEDPQARQVIERGRELLDALRSETDGRAGSRDGGGAFDEAVAEIDRMAAERG